MQVPTPIQIQNQNQIDKANVYVTFGLKILILVNCLVDDEDFELSKKKKNKADFVLSVFFRSKEVLYRYKRIFLGNINLMNKLPGYKNNKELFYTENNLKKDYFNEKKINIIDSKIQKKYKSLLERMKEILNKDLFETVTDLSEYIYPNIQKYLYLQYILNDFVLIKEIFKKANLKVLSLIFFIIFFETLDLYLDSVFSKNLSSLIRENKSIKPDKVFKGIYNDEHYKKENRRIILIGNISKYFFGYLKGKLNFLFLKKDNLKIFLNKELGIVKNEDIASGSFSKHFLLVQTFYFMCVMKLTVILLRINKGEKLEKEATRTNIMCNCMSSFMIEFYFEKFKNSHKELSFETFFMIFKSIFNTHNYIVKENIVNIRIGIIKSFINKIYQKHDMFIRWLVNNKNEDHFVINRIYRILFRYIRDYPLGEIKDNKFLIEKYEIDAAKHNFSFFKSTSKNICSIFGVTDKIFGNIEQDSIFFKNSIGSLLFEVK